MIIRQKIRFVLRQKKSRNEIKNGVASRQPHPSIKYEIKLLIYAGINPVIKINTNNPKIAYNSGNTANTMVVPNTL